MEEENVDVEIESEFDMAEHHLRRAFDLNPNDTDRQIMKGRLLTFRGRPEEAQIYLETACRLNPLRPRGYEAHFGSDQGLTSAIGTSAKARRTMRCSLISNCTACLRKP